MPRFNLEGRIENLSGEGPAAWVWVPTEQVLLTQLQVPGKRAAEWRQALPFVLEEQLAQPIEQLHFAVLSRQEKGEQAGLTSVAVVDQNLMQAWLAELKAEGLADAQLVPDCFQLPVPTEGCWSQAGGLVRSGLNSGMAVSPNLVPIFAQQAQVSLEQVESNDSLSASERMRLGLRQGAFQIQSQGHSVWSAWQGVFWSGGVLFALFLAQASWQTQQLTEQKQALQEQTEGLFHKMFPEVKRLVNLRVQTKNQLSRESVEAVVGPASVLTQVESVFLPYLKQKHLRLGEVNWHHQRLELQLFAEQTQTMERLRNELAQQFKVELKLQNVKNEQAEAVLYVRAN